MTALNNILSENWRNVDLFSVDGAFNAITVPGGSSALEAVYQLIELHEMTGHWPVMLGPPSNLERLRGSFEFDDTSLEDILAESEADYDKLLNPPEAMESKALEALGQRALANPSDRALWNRWVKAEERKTLANAFGPLPELEDWPEDPVPLTSMRTAWHYRTKEPLPEVVIALLPLAHPWDVFAHLQFGGWNDCPYSAEHVAWWRYWYEQHNAVVLGVTTNTVEAYVHNPPTTREEAARLAYQQYACCSDIVNQGVGSIEDLAANLLQRETWHFWWD